MNRSTIIVSSSNWQKTFDICRNWYQDARYQQLNGSTYCRSNCCCITANAEHTSDRIWQQCSGDYCGSSPAERLRLYCLQKSQNIITSLQSKKRKCHSQKKLQPPNSTILKLFLFDLSFKKILFNMNFRNQRGTHYSFNNDIKRFCKHIHIIYT